MFKVCPRQALFFNFLDIPTTASGSRFNFYFPFFYFRPCFILTQTYIAEKSMKKSTNLLISIVSIAYTV